MVAGHRDLTHVLFSSAHVRNAVREVYLAKPCDVESLWHVSGGLRLFLGHSQLFHSWSSSHYKCIFKYYNITTLFTSVISLVRRFLAASLQPGKTAGSATDQRHWFGEELNVLTGTLPPVKVWSPSTRPPCSQRQLHMCEGQKVSLCFWWPHFPKRISLGCWLIRKIPCDWSPKGIHNFHSISKPW